MHKKLLIDSKPAYRHGQLLLEDDFIDEQQFLLHARYRQNLGLHGFGVATGLEVAKDTTSVTVKPGFAIDRRGREIELKEAQTLELHGAKPGTVLHVTLGYRTEHRQAEGGLDRRIDCFAVLDLVPEAEGHDVVLGQVNVDDQGRVGSVDSTPGHRDRVRARPESVSAASLAPSLRRGWVTLAFHPSRIPPDEDDSRPPYRVGATRAMAHKVIDGHDNKKGAGGSMAIPLPPGVRAVLRLRVAGDASDGKLEVKLVRGGFATAKDGKGVEHKRDVLLDKTIEKAGSYRETYKVPEDLRDYNDPTHPDYPNDTLSIDIRSPGFSSVSMVAVEVSY